MTPACLLLRTSTAKGPSPPGSSPGLAVFLLTLATLPAALGCNPQHLRPILEPEGHNPVGLKMRVVLQEVTRSFPGSHRKQVSR